MSFLLEKSCNFTRKINKSKDIRDIKDIARYMGLSLIAKGSTVSPSRQKPPRVIHARFKRIHLYSLLLPIPRTEPDGEVKDLPNLTETPR